ncbi:MAG TPA: hypothetical protein VKV39_02060 [Candidatus Sulfotelmatobacter sp.]|nr:hypothetical protein [Candidatus Sulfotelmatobacter sp.]
MSTKKLARVAIVVAQVILLLGAAYATDNQGQEITVRVIDEVGVPAKEWEAAKLFADKILRSAGVPVTWVRCLWNPATGNTDCPLSEIPNQLSLLVVSEQTARRLRDHAEAFGMALVLPNGSFGSRGYVFYGRIQIKCAEKHEINEESLLGAVVAHEIGHLLLGPNSHSRVGIMKPEFDRNDVRGIMLSALKFDHRQSEALRVAVTSRVQASRSQQANPLYISEASMR